MRLVAEITYNSQTQTIVVGAVLAVLMLVLFLVVCNQDEAMAKVFFVYMMLASILIVCGVANNKEKTEYRYICEDPTLTVRELEEKYDIIQGPKGGYWILEEKTKKAED